MLYADVSIDPFKYGLGKSKWLITFLSLQALTQHLFEQGQLVVTYS